MKGWLWPACGGDGRRRLLCTAQEGACGQFSHGGDNSIKDVHCSEDDLSRNFGYRLGGDHRHGDEDLQSKDFCD